MVRQSAQISGKLDNSIQTVLVVFGGHRIIIDVPTLDEYMSQHDDYSTIQINGRILHINLFDAFQHFLSGQYDIHKIDEQTIEVDVTELAASIGLIETSWQQKAEQHDWSEDDINDFRWVLQNLFPTIDNMDEVIDEMLQDRSEDELDVFFGKISNFFSECEMSQETACNLLLLRSGRSNDQNIISGELDDSIETVLLNFDVHLLEMPTICELMLQHSINPIGERALCLGVKASYSWQGKVEQHGWSKEITDNFLLAMRSLFPDNKYTDDSIKAAMIEVLDDYSKEEEDELFSLISDVLDAALRDLALAGLYGLNDIIVPGFERPCRHSNNQK